MKLFKRSLDLCSVPKIFCIFTSLNCVTDMGKLPGTFWLVLVVMFSLPNITQLNKLFVPYKDMMLPKAWFVYLKDSIERRLEMEYKIMPRSFLQGLQTLLNSAATDRFLMTKQLKPDR